MTVASFLGSCRVGSLAGPISSQAALVFLSSLVSLAFAGHLGGLALSQAVLASSVYNITGAAVLLGLASGMETLCGQVRACAVACPHSDHSFPQHFVGTTFLQGTHMGT